MKLPALCLVVLMPAWVAAASAPAATADPNDIERLLDAIARIESHGDPKAVGDGGRALRPPTRFTASTGKPARNFWVSIGLIGTRPTRKRRGAW
jgi:hypothetical protein